MKDNRFVLHLTPRISSLLLVIGLLLIAIRPASAAQTPSCTASPSSASIAISSFSIASGASNGTIGSVAQVLVAFNCGNAFPNGQYNPVIQAGNLASRDVNMASPTGSGVMFTTSLAGIDVLLTATSAQASSNGGPNGTPGWPIGTINCRGNQGDKCVPAAPFDGTTTFTAQLVKTGPITPGTTQSINLLQFFDTETNYGSASSSFGTLILNPVVVSMSTCSVTTPSQNLAVTLPTVSVSALNGTGTVAGTTSFQIQYSCSSGSSLYLTVNTTTPGAAAGVILPPASCTAGAPAANVGVRLLQGDGQTAVSFGIAQPLGNSPNGTLTIPYYAQYYATGTPVGAGPTCATATFTMSYN